MKKGDLRKRVRSLQRKLAVQLEVVGEQQATIGSLSDRVRELESKLSSLTASVENSTRLAKLQVHVIAEQRDVAEWTMLLREAWPQYEAFFGRQFVPVVPIELHFAATFDEMCNYIRRLGGTPPSAGAGGYTFRPVVGESRVVSCATSQPSRWYTRALILHEMAHQFYFHVFGQTTNSDLPFWWCEGTVETLSLHTWNGSTLRTGVVPPLTLENYAKRALKLATASDFRLANIVDEKENDRAVGAMFVHYLHSQYSDEFRELSRTIMQKPFPSSARVLQVLKLDERTLLKRFVAWLEQHQEPFDCKGRFWDCLSSDAVIGVPEALFVSECHLRSSSTSTSSSSGSKTSLSTTMRMQHFNTRGGVLLADAHVKVACFIENWSSELVVVLFGHGHPWTVKLKRTIERRADASYAVSVRLNRRKNTCRLKVNGLRIEIPDDVPVVGPLGLVAQLHPVHFSDIHY